MGNKLLILSMSCNRDDYLFEEKIILNTWGKPIINGEYDNIKLWFFRGGEETRLDEENHVLFVKESDTLKSTYKKNLAAFNFFIENDDFDWVIMTNTSTVLNIPLLNKLVNSDILEEDNYYGGELIMQLKSYPFFRGDLILLSRKVVQTLDYHDCDKYNDVAIFNSLICKDVYFHNFLNKLRQLKSVFDITHINLNDIGSYFSIRTKQYDRKNTGIISINIVGCYSFLCSDKKEYDLKTLVYSPKYVETNNGIYQLKKIEEFEKF